jgi:hypothetical protein
MLAASMLLISRPEILRIGNRYSGCPSSEAGFFAAKGLVAEIRNFDQEKAV